MMNNINNFINKFHLEKAGQFNILKQLPDESIDCVITSPPYYALRDYGVDGQIGLESSFNKYLDNLINLFAEVKRVLKPTGTVWVNLGDSYNSGGNYRVDDLNNLPKLDIIERGRIKIDKKLQGLQDKCLINIPSRFAIRMTDELGFILRNEIIWYKRNCMPSSVKDRFTVDFEKIYFFTKSKKYYFEQQLEKAIVGYKGIDFIPNSKKDKESISLTCATGASWNNRTDDLQMIRNKRCVWDIPTQPYKEAHFATFPEDLVKPMLKSGCPEFVCSNCGKPKMYISKPKLSDESNNKLVEYDDTKPYAIQERSGDVITRDLPTLQEIKIYLNKWKGNYTIQQIEDILQSQAPHHWFNGESYPTIEDWYEIKKLLNFDDLYDEKMTTIKYKPSEKCQTEYETYLESSCSCNAGFTSGIVLDPFMGSGTTALVAIKQNKKFIGLDINEEYIKLAEKRIKPYLLNDTLF